MFLKTTGAFLIKIPFTRAMPLLPEFVKLEPTAHKYFAQTGEEYLSVSKVLHHVEPLFDSERISYFKARKECRVELRTDVTGIEPDESMIRFRQKILLAQWADKNRASTDVGTRIHNCIENYAKTKMPCGDLEYDQAAHSVWLKYLAEYKIFHAEEVLYSKFFRVAGTADFLGIRKGGKSPVVDIVDYKTNASKGIVHRSDYNNYLLEPVQHMEQCNYNHYCLQQSIYMRFLEEHGFTPGQIRLIYIPPTDPLNHFPIPVPYLKLEAEAILLHLNSKGILHARSR